MYARKKKNIIKQYKHYPIQAYYRKREYVHRCFQCNVKMTDITQQLCGKTYCYW